MAETGPARGTAGEEGREIARRWRVLGESERPRDPSRLASWARTLVRAGLPLLAYDVARHGLEVTPGDVSLREVAGLALARSGAARQARPLLEGLVEEGHAGVETAGVLARVLKDLALEEPDPAARLRAFVRARDAYATCHGRQGEDVWTGINAATLSAVVGDETLARELAERVRARCAALLEEAGAPDAVDPYWLHATLGEAALVLGEEEAAARAYGEAARLATGRKGDVASTRKNARLLESARPGALALVREAMPVPPLLVFVGHMADAPDRARPRFPPARQQEVRARIAQVLAALGPTVVYASAACGADLLFLEEAQRLGHETHVVLPYVRREFREDSVDVVPGGDWGERFDRVLEHATAVAEVSRRRMRWGSLSYEHAGRMVLGLARTHARRLDAEVRGLAVWDGRPGDGPGGTAWTVGLWRELGVLHDVIPLGVGPAGAAEPPEASSPPTPPGASRDRGRFDVAVMAVLFADAKGFSRLDEWQVPTFIERVLGAVGEITHASPSRPEVSNTWGDGLYMVFRSAGDAGRFALELVDLFQRLRPSLEGFPSDFDVRIALHAGPVYAFEDPVTRSPTYGGNHVSYTARIEPVAPAGQVYASRWFAAQIELEGAADLACDYVGETDFAKDYGRHPIFRVRRVGGPS